MRVLPAVLALSLLITSSHAARAEDAVSTVAVTTVPVTFRGPTLYRVLAGRASCTAPCVLDLPPGPNHLLLVAETGGRRGTAQATELEQDVVIPAQPTSVIVDLGPRTRRTIGKVFTVAGAVVLAAGAATLVAGLASGGGSEGSERSTSRLAVIIGGTFGGLGAAYLAVGGALWASGGERVLELRAASDPPPPPVRLTGLGVTPLPGGGAAAGLSLAF